MKPRAQDLRAHPCPRAFSGAGTLHAFTCLGLSLLPSRHHSGFHLSCITSSEVSPDPLAREPTPPLWAGL